MRDEVGGKGENRGIDREQQEKISGEKGWKTLGKGERRRVKKGRNEILKQIRRDRHTLGE